MSTNPETSWAAFMVLLIAGLAGAFVIVHLVPLWVRSVMWRADGGAP